MRRYNAIARLTQSHVSLNGLNILEQAERPERPSLIILCHDDGCCGLVKQQGMYGTHDKASSSPHYRRAASMIAWFDLRA
jgi:hypothetical protein